MRRPLLRLLAAALGLDHRMSARSMRAIGGIEPHGGGGGGGEPPSIDPIIAGLLKRLPKSGEVWPEAERKLWLQLLEGSFKLIYKEKEAAN